MTTATTTPFTFNRDYRDHEQVRPYFADYCTVRAELESAGAYPYNERFKGRIASLAGTDDKNEDTAIYMLQTMYDRDRDTAKRDAFIASGGFPAENLDPDASPVRGDLAVFGEYVGGTGWRVHKNVRVFRTMGRVCFIPPRARTPRTEFGGALYFRPVSS